MPTWRRSEHTSSMARAGCAVLTRRAGGLARSREPAGNPAASRRSGPRRQGGGDRGGGAPTGPAASPRLAPQCCLLAAPLGSPEAIPLRRHNKVAASPEGLPPLRHPDPLDRR